MIFVSVSVFLKVPFFDFWRPPVMVSFFEFKLPPGKHHIHWKCRAYSKSFAGFRIQSVLSGVLFKEFCNTRIFWACRIFYIQITNENFAKIEILKIWHALNVIFQKYRFFVKIRIFQNLNFGKIFICELNVEYSTRPENSTVENV